MRVQDHLRVADGAAGEVDQAGVAGPRTPVVPRRRGHIHGGVVADAAIGTVRARLVNHDGDANRRALLAHLRQLLRAGPVRHDGDGLRQLRAILDVLGGQQSGAGDADGSQLHQAQHRLPPLWDARQHDQHALAGANAQLLEGMGGAAALLVKMDEGVALLAPVRPDPLHRQLVRLLRPAPNRVHGEVVVVRNRPFEFAPRLLIARHVVLLALSRHGTPPTSVCAAR